MASATSVSSLSTITGDQFLQLLVTQLQNQDPLNPVDASTFLNSIASLDTVSSISSLSASFASLLQLEQLTNGSSLIGHSVTYTNTSGAQATGTVTGLSVQNGNFLVDIGTTQIGLSQISSVN